MRLSELSRQTAATVEDVEDREPADPISQRLRELGFVKGERVYVATFGPFGGRDPLVVQVGFTRFALRKQEAARVRVHTEAAQQLALASSQAPIDITPPSSVRRAA